TAAIQTAFDAAFGPATAPHGVHAYLNRGVYFPGGTYVITNPILIYGVSGAIISGAGMGATRIVNRNEKNPGVFVTNGFGYSTVEEMYLSPGARGIGFDWDWDHTSPCSNQKVLFKHVFFEGGLIGCRVGASGYQSDSSIWVDCAFIGCSDAGLKVLNPNACTLGVYGGDFADNGNGIDVADGAVNTIIGAEFEATPSWGYDISIRGGGAETYIIAGIRTESANFFYGGNGAINFNIIGCSHGSGAGPGVFARADGPLHIDGCVSTQGEVLSGNPLTIENSIFWRHDALSKYDPQDFRFAEIRNCDFGKPSSLANRVHRRRITPSGVRTLDVEASSLSDPNFLYSGVNAAWKTTKWPFTISANDNPA